MSGISGVFGVRSTPCQATFLMGMVSLDVRGHIVRLSREDAERLRARAAAEAGTSGRARDLALVLDWALATPQTIVLRRGEASEFLRFAREDQALAAAVAHLAA